MIDKESSFLYSLNKIFNDHQKAIIDLLHGCSHIAKEYSDAKHHSEQDKFNLFHVISDLYYRENFHSDIVAFLLDPNANHGYKQLMLNNFIALLNSNGCVIESANYRDAIVVREKAKIDILIKSASNKRAIIIENKINKAGDMPRQLPRYYDYVIEQYTIDAVVYLPLDYNKYPDMEDWTDDDKGHIIPLLKIIPAYDNMHRMNLVEDWLLKSLPQIDNIDVVSSIRQYSDLIITLNNNNMDSIILEKFYKELQQADNLKTAQSIRNMLNDMPTYLAQRIQNKFGGACLPYEKVWIYNSHDAVFEKGVVDGIYTKMDIWCYEERYDVVFWSPTDDLPEEAFSNLIGKIHSLEGFEPKENAKNQIVRHFGFTEEGVLFNFIQSLLKELSVMASS